jgi:hypothetical protein
VQHAGLVRVLDDDVDDDAATFLVMELLRGSTLTPEWEAGGPLLPAVRVIEVAHALLDVLEAVHAQAFPRLQSRHRGPPSSGRWELSSWTPRRPATSPCRS